RAMFAPMRPTPTKPILEDFITTKLTHSTTNRRETRTGRFEKKVLPGGQLQASERLQGKNSGVRSCRIHEQGLYPKIQDQHLPGKIFAKLPDSLAPTPATPDS